MLVRLASQVTAPRSAQNPLEHSQKGAFASRLCLSSVAPFLFSVTDTWVPPVSFVSLPPSASLSLAAPLRIPVALDHSRRPAWSLEMLGQGSNSPTINPRLPHTSLLHSRASFLALPLTRHEALCRRPPPPLPYLSVTVRAPVSPSSTPPRRPLPPWPSPVSFGGL